MNFMLKGDIAGTGTGSASSGDYYGWDRYSRQQSQVRPQQYSHLGPPPGFGFGSALPFLPVPNWGVRNWNIYSYGGTSTAGI
jgi:hypothetical protein